MIKVANILEEGKLGGPAYRVIRVAEALPREVETTVIIPKFNSEDFVKLCESADINYKKLSLTGISKTLPALLRYVFFSPFEIVNLYLYLKKEKFDIIHISGGSWMIKGVIAGYLAGIHVIWHINDTSMPKLIRILFSLVSPLANSYIFASKRSKAYYKPLISKIKPWHLVPSPVNINVFDPSLELSINNDTHHWDNKIIIGLVGNISPVKGIETFIQAALNIDDQNKYHFMIIGNIFKSQKKYYNSLKEIIPPEDLHRFEFIGGIQDVRPYLQKIDIYVCSSNFESSPISVWEAMAMEKPVISTDVGDVPLFIENNVNGIVVKTRDHKAITSAIKKLTDDKALRDIFGKRARQTIVSNLSLEHCVKRHLEAYKAGLNKS